VSGGRLGRHVEGRVVRDNASRARGAERGGLEVFRWDAGKAEVRIDLEAEAAVILRLSQQDAAGRALFSKNA